MVILVTARSGGGKTTFCERLLTCISADYFNNDAVREATNNWDFSDNGRRLAVTNMLEAVASSSARIKVIDMIAPTKELRRRLSPDIIVFIDSDLPTKYQDTAFIYERPTEDECSALLVAKFDHHQEIVDLLVDEVSVVPKELH